jgi:uncharacterized protein (DUF1778 family)
MRSVVPIRLSDEEREQINTAAARLKLPLSSFIRQASLQASAVVEQKVSPAVARPAEFEEPRELVVIEPARHMVDGEWVSR